MNETANNQTEMKMKKGNTYIMTSNGMGNGGLVPVFGPMSFARAQDIVSTYPHYKMAARIDVEREFGGNAVIKPVFGSKK